MVRQGGAKLPLCPDQKERRAQQRRRVRWGTDCETARCWFRGRSVHRGSDALPKTRMGDSCDEESTQPNPRRPLEPEWLELIWILDLGVWSSVHGKGCARPAKRTSPASRVA